MFFKFLLTINFFKRSCQAEKKINRVDDQDCHVCSQCCVSLKGDLLLRLFSESINDSIEPDNTKSWELRFLSSPIELLSTGDGRIRSVRIEKNRLTVS